MAADPIDYFLSTTAESKTSSMTLAVPNCAEVAHLRAARKRRKMSLGTSPLLAANGRHLSPPPRRTSIADAFSESFRTLALTARRNSSPLTRKSTKKTKKSRLISKNGICNVYNTNVPKKDRQYLRDIFTTMIDVKWRFMFLIFALVFISSWTTFATVYYFIAYVHGDITDAMPLNHTACIENIESFYASFLFAVETHHTIGYGHRYITTECKTAGFTVCLQCICGLLIQSFMVGLVFAKMARPKKRAETIIFSEKAVVCLRDGQLCFLCRVGDMRNTHLVEAHVRLQFISDRETSEGEIEPLHQFEMKVGPTITDDDRIFLVWPTTLCHVIDKESPLYEYTAQGLPSAQFEIIVLLEGIVESTGMTAQARTSYLPCEILWGHRFRKLVTYQRTNGSYQIDYNLFNCTYPVKTPTCSAADYANDRNVSSKEYFCRDTKENQLEDARSWDSTPTPSLFTSYPASPMSQHCDPKASQCYSTDRYCNNTKTESTSTSCAPPTIVVQCPSTCSSPNHREQRRDSSNSNSNSLLSIYTSETTGGSVFDVSMITRPSTALSDLEEECEPLCSPIKHQEMIQETAA